MGTKSPFVACEGSITMDEATRYINVATGGMQNSVETNEENTFKFSGTLSNAFIRIKSNGTTAASTFKMQIASVDKNLSITVGAGLTDVFVDTINSDVVAVDDVVVWEVVVGTTGNLNPSIVAVLFENDTDTNTILHYIDTSGVGDGTTQYTVLAGLGGNNATETFNRSKFGSAGTMQNLKIVVTTNSTTSSSTITLHKNGTNVSITIPIGAGLLDSFTDYVNTDSFVDGDEYTYEIVNGGGGNLVISRMFIQLTTTDFKAFFLGATGQGETLDDNNTVFYPPSGLPQADFTDETDAKMEARVFFNVSNVHLRISVNGTSATNTLTSRIDGVDGTISVTVGSGLIGVFSDTTNSDDVTATQDFNWKWVVPLSTSFITTRSLCAVISLPRSVQKTSILKHTIIGIVQKTTIFKHGIIGLVQKTTIFKHNIIEAIQKSTIFKHNLDGLVQKTTIFKHTVIEAIQKSTIFKHNIKTLVQKTTIFKHNIIEAIQKSTIFKHSLAGSVQKTTIFKHNIDTLVQKSTIFKHNLRTAIQKSTIFKHNLRTAIQKTTIFKHTVIEAIQKTTIFKHTVIEAIQKSTIFKHNIIEAIQKSTIFKHNLDGLVQKTTIFKHNIGEFILIIRKSITLGGTTSVS